MLGGELASRRPRPSQLSQHTLETEHEHRALLRRVALDVQRAPVGKKGETRVFGNVHLALGRTLGEAAPEALRRLAALHRPHLLPRQGRGLRLVQRRLRRRRGLDPAEATSYRGITARANYLAVDRPDLVYSVKELCRGMAKPTKVYWHKLKRLGRYLVDTSRTIVKYDW